MRFPVSTQNGQCDAHILATLKFPDVELQVVIKLISCFTHILLFMNHFSSFSASQALQVTWMAGARLHRPRWSTGLDPARHCRVAASPSPPRLRLRRPADTLCTVRTPFSLAATCIPL